jgi:undecaprenyl-diphosphatase
MADILRSIILGIVQGLTEFLPVSSSGHLEIAKYILGDDSLGSESLAMTVMLHGATALATLYVFRKEVMEILNGLWKGSMSELQFSGKIILSMIPAAFIGLFFEDQIDYFFEGRILLVCSMLLITAFLLWMADRIERNDREVSWSDALIVGIAQAVAILPGISRSGATIATSVFLNIDRSRAARFSFLMVVPLILGKMSKDILFGDMFASGENMISMGTGFIAAFFTGVFACRLMIRLVEKSKLIYFAFYCAIVGIFGIIYFTLVV